MFESCSGSHSNKTKELFSYISAIWIDLETHSNSIQMALIITKSMNCFHFMCLKFNASAPNCNKTIVGWVRFLEKKFSK